jgi:hypothetical protein
VSAWPFVIAAYTLAAVATIGLTLASLVAMRKAERAAEALRRR